MTHDDAKAGLRRPDTAQRTIDHTDIEDGLEQHGGDRSEFEHMHNSPDYKLRSIEVDDELTGRRIKKLVNANNDVDSQEGTLPEDDNSGTGHRSNK